MNEWIAQLTLWSPLFITIMDEKVNIYCRFVRMKDMVFCMWTYTRLTFTPLRSISLGIKGTQRLNLNAFPRPPPTRSLSVCTLVWRVCHIKCYSRPTSVKCWEHYKALQQRVCRPNDHNFQKCSGYICLKQNKMLHIVTLHNNGTLLDH